MAVPFEKIEQTILSGDFAPVYFLTGKEPYFVDRIANLIEEKALEETQKAFNQTLVYGKDTNIPEVLGLARKFPVMAERQTVFVREAQDISDWKKEKSLTLLKTYLSNPVPSTILVFSYKHKTLTKSSALYKEFDKNSVMLDSPKIYSNQMPVLIRSMAVGKGLKLNDKAVDLLFELIGNDLERINGELSKMTLVEDHEGEIDDRMVLKYIGHSNPYTMLDLHQALSHYQAEKSFNIALRLVETDESMVLPMLGSLYTFYLRVFKAVLAKSGDANGLAKELGVNYYQAQDLLIAKRKYSYQKVQAIFDWLLEADKQFKGVSESSSSAEGVVKQLLGKIYA